MIPLIFKQVAFGAFSKAGLTNWVMRTKYIRVSGLLGILILTIIVYLTPFSDKTAIEHRQEKQPPRLEAFSFANAPRATNGVPWHKLTNGHPQLSPLVPLLQNIANTSTTASPAFLSSNSINLSPPQEVALKQLIESRGGSISVYLRPDRLTPMQIKGDLFDALENSSLSAEEQSQQTATAFLHANRELLLLNDIEQEMKLAHQEHDELGGTILRYAQQYQGLPVWPCEMAVHLDAEGNVDLVDGAYVATPEGTPTTPQYSSNQASEKVRAIIPGGHSGRLTDSTLLVYAPLDGEARLAWKFELSIGLAQHWIVVIDAMDGKSLKQVNTCMCSSATGSGIDQLGVRRPLNIVTSGNTHFLIDASKPMFNATTGEGLIEIHNAKGVSINNLALEQLAYVTSSSPTSWSLPSAVSASFNFSQTYDYFQEHHNRNSFDGNGSTFYAVVNIGNYPNASWNSQLSLMLFGNVDNYAASLDVIGHEFAHGVTSSVGGGSGLDYENQPGALNESFSDIFGEMVEARTEGTNDWLIGTRMQAPLRNMANPGAFSIGNTGRKYPSKMSEFFPPTDPIAANDHGGVHYNSSIINRTFYLLVSGLPQAIGRRDAARIFYRCLTAHMKPQSQFIDARLGCIASAEAIFGSGSIQAIKTAEAFDAVEIYATPVAAPEPPAVREPISVADSALFIYRNTVSGLADLARREATQGDGTTGRTLLFNVKKSRVSVTGDGNFAVFVGNENSFGIISTETGIFETAAAGSVYSVTISPDGKYIAFVLLEDGQNPSNKIYIVEIATEEVSIINLVTPVVDGPPLPNILYADSMEFSSDSKYLIYDALSSVRNPDGSNRRAWSIFVVDVQTSAQLTVIPPIAGYAIGNPAFSNTGDRYITFEAISPGRSDIAVADLFDGSLGFIAATSGRAGYPAFNGNDSAIIYGDYDSQANFSQTSLYAQPLSATRIATAGSRSLYIRNGELGVIYRRGGYPQPNQPPSINIASPVFGSALASPASVNVSVNATDSDGSIARVELYEGSELLGQRTAPPYNFNFTQVSAGNYRLYARAYDNLGASTTSPLVAVRVEPSTGSKLITTGGSSRFELRLNVPQTGHFRIETSTNLTQWSSLGTVQSIEGKINFSDFNATNSARRFYRAVKLP